MFVSDALVVCKAIRTLASFITTTYKFYSEHTNLIAELKQLGIDIENGHDIYISNKSVCLEMCARVQSCQADIESLRGKSIPSANVQANIDTLVSTLESCQDLVQNNIMPDHLSFLQKQWWIGKRLMQRNTIQEQFNTQNQILMRVLQTLTTSLCIGIAKSVERTESIVSDASHDLNELRNLFLRHEAEKDATSERLLSALQPINAAQDAIQLNMSLMKDQIDDHVLELQRQVQAHQDSTLVNQEMLQFILLDLEKQLQQRHEWDTQQFSQIHNAMTSFEQQLHTHTHVIVTKISRVQSSMDEILKFVHFLSNQIMTPESQSAFDAIKSTIPSLTNTVKSNVDISNNNSTSATETWKYKFNRYFAEDLTVDFEDDSTRLGSGATGAVHLAQLRTESGVVSVAFKQFTVPPELKSTMKKVAALETNVLFDHGAATQSKSPASSSSSSSPSSASKTTSRPELLETLVRKIIREACIAASLNGHNNCVSIYGVCLDQSACGIALEYCNEKSLQDKLWRLDPDDGEYYSVSEADGALTFEQQLTCATHIISGIYFLHAKGVVHRDLKSQNVLCHNYGTKESPIFSFKINDFGSARVTKDYKSHFSNGNTASAGTASTLRWDPPELKSLTQKKKVSEEEKRAKAAVTDNPAVDIYGLGCLLGEIFTRLPPYSQCESPNAIISAQCDVNTPPFDYADIHPDILPLVSSCCARQPTARPNIFQILRKLWPEIMEKLKPTTAKQTANENGTINQSKTNNNVAHSNVVPTEQLPLASEKEVEVVPSAAQNAAAALEIAIEEKNVRFLIDEMHRNVLSADIQERICKVLTDLARDDDDQRINIVRLDGANAIITAMTQHVSSASVLQQGCRVLWNLAFNAENKLIIGNIGGIEAIINGMDQHRDVLDVQRCGCGALWNLSSNVANKTKIHSSGGIARISTAMARHINSVELQERACATLLRLAADSLIAVAIVQSSAVEAMATAMNKHAGSVSLLECCFDVLLTITLAAKGKVPIEHSQAKQAVLSAMKKHLLSGALQEKGNRIILAMADKSPATAAVISPTGSPASSSKADVKSNSVSINRVAVTASQSLSTTDKAAAEKLKSNAATALWAGRLDDAYSFYTAAIKIDSQNATYYVGRAAVLSRQCKFPPAISDCHSALEYDANNMKAHYELATALIQTHKKAEALVSFETALKLCKFDPMMRQKIQEQINQIKQNKNENAVSSSPSSSKSSTSTSPTSSTSNKVNTSKPAKTISEMIDELTTNAAFLPKVLATLSEFSRIEDKETLRQLHKSGITPEILTVMKLYPPVVKVQEDSLFILTNMLDVVAYNDFIECNGINIIVQMMQRHMDKSVDIQYTSASIIGVLCRRSPENALAINEAGGVAALIQAMKVHADVDETFDLECLSALRSLVSSQSALETICCNDGIAVITSAMKNNLASVNIQSVGRALLNILDLIPVAAHPIRKPAAVPTAPHSVVARSTETLKSDARGVEFARHLPVPDLQAEMQENVSDEETVSEEEEEVVLSAKDHLRTLSLCLEQPGRLQLALLALRNIYDHDYTYGEAETLLTIFRRYKPHHRGLFLLKKKRSSDPQIITSVCKLITHAIRTAQMQTFSMFFDPLSKALSKEWQVEMHEARTEMQHALDAMTNNFSSPVEMTDVDGEIQMHQTEEETC